VRWVAELGSLDINMSGYSKLVSKTDEVAVVDVAGWDGHAIALHPRRVERIKRDIEEIQKHVDGEGHQLAHVLWEEFAALVSTTKRKE